MVPVGIAAGVSFSLFDHNTRFFTGKTTALTIMLCHTSEVCLALQVCGPQNNCSFNSDRKFFTA